MRRVTATNPTAATGTAGERNTSTSTVTAATGQHPDADDRPRWRFVHPSGGAERPVVGHRDDQSGDQRGRHTGQSHLVEEGAPREVEVAENDHIGQVGTRQQEGTCVGEKDGGVEQCRLVLAPARAA